MVKASYATFPAFLLWLFRVPETCKNQFLQSLWVDWCKSMMMQLFQYLPITVDYRYNFLLQLSDIFTTWPEFPPCYRELCAQTTLIHKLVRILIIWYIDSWLDKNFLYTVLVTIFYRLLLQLSYRYHIYIQPLQSGWLSRPSLIAVLTYILATVFVDFLPYFVEFYIANLAQHDCTHWGCCICCEAADVLCTGQC